MDFEALPGGHLVQRGLADLEAGLDSVPALLVQVGAPRLRSLGIAVPAARVASPEHALYRLLAAANADGAHSRYNALIRALVSFERAAACVA